MNTIMYLKSIEICLEGITRNFSTQFVSQEELGARAGMEGRLYSYALLYVF